jgi:hypothetical protein
VVAELRTRVEQRRQAGLYPPDLEERMAEHFRRITAHRVTPDLSPLYDAIEDLQRRLDMRMERTPVESSHAAGAAVHKTLAKLQARQITGALEQVREFGDAVLRVVTLLTAALSDANSHVHRDLVGQIDAALERLSLYERVPPQEAEPDLPDDVEVVRVDNADELGRGALFDLAASARERLAPGGVVAATFSWLHPRYVAFLFEEAGFDVELRPGLQSTTLLARRRG